MCKVANNLSSLLKTVKKEIGKKKITAHHREIEYLKFEKRLRSRTSSTRLNSVPLQIFRIQHLWYNKSRQKVLADV